MAIQGRIVQRGRTFVVLHLGGSWISGQEFPDSLPIARRDRQEQLCAHVRYLFAAELVISRPAVEVGIVDDLDRRIVDALYEAVCDDGTIGCRAGIVSVAFTRSAATMREAIASAIRDVEKAGAGAKVVRVEPEGPDPNGDAVGTNSVLQAISMLDPRFGDFAIEILQYRNQLFAAR